MRLSDLPKLADRIEGFDELIRLLSAEEGKEAAEIEGLSGTAKGFVLSRLFARLNRPLLILTYQQEQAQRLWDDLIRFGVPQERAALLPSAPTLHLEGDITDFRVIAERISALSLLASGAPCIVIGVVEAVLQRTAPPEWITEQTFEVNAEETIELQKLLHRLVNIGYLPVSTVTQPGEFSRRGGILDIYPSTAEAPVRIEFFGDEVESVRPFDVTTQRSTGKRAGVEIGPAREAPMEGRRRAFAGKALRIVLAERLKEFAAKKNREGIDRLTDRVAGHIEQIERGVYFDGLEQYLPYLVPESVSALNYLAPNGLAVLDEPHQMREHWLRTGSDMLSSRERHRDRGDLLDAGLPGLPYEEALAFLAERKALLLSLLGREVEGFRIAHRLTIHSAPMEGYRGRLPLLADEAGTWLANDCRALVATDQPHRVREILAEMSLPVRPQEEGVGNRAGLFVLEGRLRAGFRIPALRLYILTDAELFGAARPVQTRRKIAGGVAISSVLDLKENDYVVHIQHGIGVYKGLVRRTFQESQHDCLLIEYAGGDRLYVAADQIDRVQRYVGADGAAPNINRIGGADWQRTTRKVKEQARQMAAELIRLYAARQAAQRPSFGPDTPWQAEIEEAFPYEETHGQLRAIHDVKSDMEESRPMDRLICGDVGFGKTEVAIRAAFKALSANKQVAILCPTTILAAQHFATFSERLAAYPITVELLSRFRTKQEQAKTVKGLEEGTVDIVVATHRLLSKDVKIRNLGLVIVDEEQRFGVAHKERLKQLRTSVDVLTLSATPIPRTLSMALSGLRDMSLIEDPPEGRMAVLTSVREYDDDLLRDAILREIEREGQIYFVHNRVESIYHVAGHLRKLIPELRIEIGHGQMSEEELERVMYSFYHHEADVLLCTTIIENGLDIPNANTIIIDNADHMGLAQLYQLRGRVGRSTRQAYAYLLYRKNKALTEAGELRLEAIREFSALGSGYKVAMRDLEIRGAGNLLGAEQSGAMLSVGFDLYCRILAQAVQELSGEEVVEDVLPPVDLPVTAHIPQEYIPGEAERIFFYKKMSAVRSLADVEGLEEELNDRYGDPHPPVYTALAILRLRLRCKEIGIASIRTEKADVSVRFAAHIRLTPNAIYLLSHAFRGSRFTPEGIVIPLNGPRALPQVEEMLNALEKALAKEKK